MLTQQAYDLMPRVKITDLLFEVDQWTNFTPHFTHLKSDAEPPDRTLLLTGDYVWHANKRVAKVTCLISSGHFNLGERPRLLQLNNTAA
ncbi:transposase [Burkholderia pseudomallei]|nr:transposase [Burkholderia pseudomallei]